MVINFVEITAIKHTTPWLAYASWTWEVIRRHPDYVSYYSALRNKGLIKTSHSKELTRWMASQGFPTAHKFGLLLPADPARYAGEQPVFWHPNVFHSVARFHVIDNDVIDPKHKPIQLSKFPGQQMHFLDANGTYHIRFLGDHFWFQIQCDGVEFVDENAFIGLEMNHLENPDKRLNTFREIGGIYEGTIALDSRIHVPARLESHQKSTLAYDIRSKGGTLSDVVLALKEAKLIVENPDKFVDFNETARNAFRAGKAYVYGDYLKILNRQ